MKRRFVYILLASLLFLSSCSAGYTRADLEAAYNAGFQDGLEIAVSNPEPEGPRTLPDSITVYITKSGDCYHRETCYTLKSKIPIDLDEAIANGYRPCSKCKPPGW